MLPREKTLKKAVSEKLETVVMNEINDEDEKGSESSFKTDSDCQSEDHDKGKKDKKLKLRTSSRRNL